MPVAAPKRTIRCGWCLSGDHANCAATIEMGLPANGKRASQTYTWRCPCDTEGCATTRTRCIRCRRRDVEVTDRSECFDVEDCRGFMAARRAQDPAFQIIDEVRERQAADRVARGEEMSRKAGEGSSRATEGACVCCGERTKGGKFLPGHDSRYVKAQAAAYLALPASINGLQPADRVAIYDRMEACGPALHAKWVKAVERMRAAKAKEEAA